MLTLDRTCTSQKQTQKKLSVIVGKSGKRGYYNSEGRQSLNWRILHYRGKSSRMAKSHFNYDV